MYIFLLPEASDFLQHRAKLYSGYYALNQANMGELQTLFGQLWKEYALSDSRYLTQNAFVLCMESLTAVCFKLALEALLHILTNLSDLLGPPFVRRSRHDYYSAPSSSPSPGHGVSWPILR